MHPLHTYPIPGFREPFCSLSHLFGAAVFTVLAYSFIRRARGDTARTACLSCLAFSSILLLTTSSLYHMCWPGPWREFLIRADVSAVFLLIAGSLTPVYAILFKGWSRSIPLALVWIVTVGGIVARFLSPHSSIGPLGVGLFLLFGWGNAIATVVMWRRFGWNFIKTGIASGMSYTLGAVILMLHAPTLWHGIFGPHEIWHAAVLSGMGFHWKFVSKFAAGPPPLIACPELSPNLLKFPAPTPQLRDAA